MVPEESAPAEALRPLRSVVEPVAFADRSPVAELLRFALDDEVPCVLAAGALLSVPAVVPLDCA